jgi:UbiA prenyltransferase family
METLTEERPPAGGAAPASGGGAGRRSTATALWVSLRAPEWIKNLLVFAGLLFSGKVDEPAQVLDASLAFVAFCAISSAGYLFNDLHDADHDRLHPEKRHRPIAAGELAPGTAGAAAVALTVFAVALAAAGVSIEVAGLVALYGVITVAYSLGVKRLVILDVMTIASLFCLRVVAGAVAVEAHASEWLLLCTAMLALFLGFTKRRQEAMSEAMSVEPGPASSGAEQDATGHSAKPNPEAGSRIARPVLIGSRMLATVPSVLYGIFRYLYLIYDRKDTRSTSAILIQDPGMIFAGISWVGAALVMLYVFD